MGDAQKLEMPEDVDCFWIRDEALLKIVEEGDQSGRAMTRRINIPPEEDFIENRFRRDFVPPRMEPSVVTREPFASGGCTRFSQFNATYTGDACQCVTIMIHPAQRGVCVGEQRFAEIETHSGFSHGRGHSALASQ